MCGRFTLSTEEKELEDKFQFTLDIPIAKRYNISPTQSVLALTQGQNERKAHLFRWGLVPFWAKDLKIGSKMINARSETLHEKPSFRHLIKRNRCIILSNGFFEWKKEGNKKQPYYIQVDNGKPFSFAGLWDTWSNDREQITTCTIITTTPNTLMKELHHRMPVILDKDGEKAWLDESLTDTDYLQSLMTPFASEKMHAYPVSIDVNNPRNDHADNIIALSS
ncbi:SOS response-associated peptidase [Shimazuella kribbensis]|uniref:SOS response-associated peptidase n=1 Tax=Shimazuella kribbensis TaxID=139808 RepID=UPI0003F910B6|nr:SOS response-associated peptidase [Shimazuella kribbensis]